MSQLGERLLENKSLVWGFRYMQGEDGTEAGDVVHP